MASVSNGTVLVWHVAGLEASAARHATIKAGHLFIALCKVCDLPLEEVLGDAARHYPHQVEEVRQDVAALAQAFRRVGLDVVRCRRRLRAELGCESAAPPDGVMHRSAQAREVFARADELADARRDALRPIDLLVALCEQTESPWCAVVREQRVDLVDLRDAAVRVLQDAASSPCGGAGGDREVAGPGSFSASGREVGGGQADARNFLEQFGRDLTQLAQEGRLSPVIGRRETILRLGQILLQHERNNALLVGDAGVGKTRIVEGLALRLAAGNVSEEFHGKRIIEVSMGSLVAGTKYRGEFEERVRCLLDAACDPNIILFIDEIHTMMGAGQAEGQALDAADMLKPALARGELRVIGATTPEEFSRYLEPDPALMRRFDLVWVDEPSREEALEILTGVASRLEQYHGLAITPGAIQAAIDLSIRYVWDRRLPDKAVRLLDATCARVRLQSFSGGPAAREVTRADVAATLGEQYHVPADEATEDEATRLLRLEEHLSRRVIGQEEAVEQVAAAVRSARAGLRPPNKPWAVLLFVGPTGVGKTELAKALAEFLFASEEHLVTLDMSEFAEPHAVARLIGAPAGYVGHEQGGALVEAVRRRPHCVLLLDEIEKAHPQVHRLFLQVFDEARLTDARGRQARFHDVVIIMTSNLGSELLKPRQAIGFAPAPQTASTNREALRDHLAAAVSSALPTELLNRIDRVVFFYPLSRESVRQVIDKLLQPVRQRLAARRINLQLDDAAYELLMREGYSEQFGARAMDRAIARLLADPLSQMLLASAIPDGSTIFAIGQPDSIVLTRA